MGLLNPELVDMLAISSISQGWRRNAYLTICPSHQLTGSHWIPSIASKMSRGTAGGEYSWRGLPKPNVKPRTCAEWCSSVSSAKENSKLWLWKREDGISYLYSSVLEQIQINELLVSVSMYLIKQLFGRTTAWSRRIKRHTVSGQRRSQGGLYGIFLVGGCGVVSSPTNNRQSYVATPLRHTTGTL